MLCTIWYHLYNLKNVENTHGGVLLLVKLQNWAFLRLQMVQMIPNRATHHNFMKWLPSITYIKSASNMKASFDKIWMRLWKSNDGKESWLPEGLDKVFNSMISENVIELIDVAYKIKPDQKLFWRHSGWFFGKVP